MTDEVDRPPSPTWTADDVPIRGLTPGERDAVARLARRYPDLRMIEMELDELQRLRGEQGAPPMGSPYSASDLMDLHDAGLISSDHVRQLVGVERRRRASAWNERPAASRAAAALPPMPRVSIPDGLRSLAQEWWVRLTWALVWRWIGLGAGIALLPSAAEVRAADGKHLIELLAIVAVVLSISVVCVIAKWWRRPTLLGSLVRLLLTIVVINLAFLLPTGLLTTVMLVGFLGLTADAFAAVFWWSRPRAAAAHHSANEPSG
jgi:hypothetical protein